LKLSDTQHTLAREYGFESWPKLKAYVKTLGTSPFVGKWKADLAKSKQHPANPFQSATLEFTVAGNTVTIFDSVLDAAGREEHNKNMLRVDGKEHSSKNGYSLVAQWNSSHAFERIARLLAGVSIKSQRMAKLSPSQATSK
jgi:hypothetical protein